MPTTTDQSPGRGLPLVAVAAALAGWIGVTALATLAVQPDTVVVIGPPLTLAAAGEGSLISMGRAYLVIQPTAPGAAGRLYLRGAWLVLPASLSGCLGNR